VASSINADIDFAKIILDLFELIKITIHLAAFLIAIAAGAI